MTNVWFTSDTHFFHANIVKFQTETRGGYDNCEEMSEKLIENWNSQVAKDDYVYHCGDFCFGGLDRVLETPGRLNGKIVLILGNHDHHAQKKSEVRSLFHEVHPILFCRLYKQFIHFCHYPIASWNMMNDGAWHIHGHVHGEPMRIPGKIMDVGIDTRTDLKLYSWEEVETHMKAQPTTARHQHKKKEI